jgi:hypothetical protein
VPLASSSHSFHDNKNYAYLYAHIKNASNVSHHDVCYDNNVLPMCHDDVFDSHAMIASSSSSYVHGRSRPRRHVHHVVSHAPRNASNCTTMLHMRSIVKMIKLLLKMWGLNAKEAKLAFGFQNLM